MLVFTTKTFAPAFKTPNVRAISLAYAGLLTLFVLAQLFTFEEFVPLVESFWLPGGRTAAYLVASVIVSAEVFALPFLLNMKLSLAMNYFSLLMSWVASLLWVYVTLWLNLTVNAVSNVGFLGTVVELPVGWWAVFFSATLVLFAAWCSWGMWPRAEGGR